MQLALVEALNAMHALLGGQACMQTVNLDMQYIGAVQAAIFERYGQCIESRNAEHASKEGMA